MMNGTGLDHRLVRDYLRELDAALATLPAARARELRQQITAHLDEALPPGADDQGVAPGVGRLGSPTDVAAAAGAAVPARLSAVSRAAAGARLARVGRRTWIRLAAAVAVTGIGAGYLAFYLAAGSLEVGPQSRWWYRQDWTREVSTTADGATQTTVPIRSGQRQGFAVGIYNPTDVTQTIVGVPGPGDGSVSPAAQTAQVAVSVPNWDIDNGGFITNVRFALPGVIPPHQLRLLRVTWISDICLRPRGATTVMDQISLRVRVGWFTRTEHIPLGQGWGVSGPSQGACY